MILIGGKKQLIVKLGNIDKQPANVLQFQQNKIILLIKMSNNVFNSFCIKTRAELGRLVQLSSPKL